MRPAFDADRADALNRWQRKLALQFDGGLHVDLVKATHWRLYIKEPGDLLFRYLMLELSSVEGCNSVKEAHKRIQEAIDRLELALGVFMPIGKAKP